MQISGETSIILVGYLDYSSAHLHSGMRVHCGELHLILGISNNAAESLEENSDEMTTSHGTDFSAYRVMNRGLAK